MDQRERFDGRPLRDRPDFHEWLADRARRAEGDADRQESLRVCGLCGDPIAADSPLVGECLTCLALAFGTDLGEREAIDALASVVCVALVDDPDLLAQVLAQLRRAAQPPPPPLRSV